MVEQDLEVIFNRRVALNAFFMGLRSPQIVAEARPGQFVMVRVHSGSDPFLRRPFSISGTRGNDLFLILYRVVGRGTALMSKARTGQKLSVLGPLGIGFMPPETGQRSLFVAGGIGIAPLIFLAREIRERIEVFLAGYGTAEEIVGLDGLPDLGLALATDDGTCGHKGPVTDLLQARLESPARDQRMVFACGPLPMLKRVAAITLARNIPCQVSLEGSMACGLGACQGCAIRGLSGQKPAYLHVCHDGPVFDVKSIDWKVL